MPNTVQAHEGQKLTAPPAGHKPGRARRAYSSAVLELKVPVAGGYSRNPVCSRELPFAIVVPWRRCSAHLHWAWPAVGAIELALELSSEVPGTAKDWPSDITIAINGREIDTWTAPVD